MSQQPYVPTAYVPGQDQSGQQFHGAPQHQQSGGVFAPQAHYGHQHQFASSCPPPPTAPTLGSVFVPGQPQQPYGVQQHQQSGGVFIPGGRQPPQQQHSCYGQQQQFSSSCPPPPTAAPPERAFVPGQQQQPYGGAFLPGGQHPPPPQAGTQGGGVPYVAAGQQQVQAYAPGQRQQDDRAGTQGGGMPYLAMGAAGAGAAAVVGASYVAYQHHHKNSTAYQDEFRRLDVDNSGYLDKEELERMFWKCMPRQISDAAMRVADTNKDGKVSMDEYVAIRNKLVTMGFAAAAVAAVGGASYMAYRYQNNQQAQQGQKAGQSIASQQNPSGGGSGDDETFLYRNEFVKLDADGSGHLEKRELEKLLGRWVPMGIIGAAMKVVDADRDGKVSMEEYVAIRRQMGDKIPGL